MAVLNLYAYPKNDSINSSDSHGLSDDTDCLIKYKQCLTEAGLKRSKCYASAVWPTFGVRELAILAACAAASVACGPAYKICLASCLLAFTTVNLVVLVCDLKKCDKQYDADKNSCDDAYKKCLDKL
jgi:hypothetical protein